MDLVVFILAMGGLALLITLGNERNRAAIERVNSTAQEWAIQDLRLKRGTAQRAIEITDVAPWLQSVTSKALGTAVRLSEPEFVSGPDAVVCLNRDTEAMYAFSPHSPKELEKHHHEKKKSALDGATTNPLAVRLSRKTGVRPLNILNAGVLFDLELPIAWKKLTGQSLATEQLWLYIFP